MAKEKEEFEDVDLFESKESDQKATELDKEESVVAEANQDAEFEVPKKFQGKELEDVIQSYVNLEKKLGNTTNELSDLRKLTDEIVKRGLDKSETADPDNEPEIGFEDFVEAPSAAIEKALAKNPRLQALEREISANRQASARETLMKRHEDATDLASDEDFIRWVATSRTRARLFKEANDSYDSDTIGDLMDDYKSTAGLSREENRSARDEKAKRDLKNAITEKGGGGADSQRKPRYKRSELIRLKIEQPRRYAEMAEQIREAYQDGRVI